MEWVHCLFLFPPYFRETVHVTCKIGSYLCSLDTLLQKNVIVFLFWKWNFKMALIWKKKVYFWPTFLISFSYQGKVTKIPLAHISLTYIHKFCSPIKFLLPYQFWKKKKDTNSSGMVSLWYDSWCWFLFAPFWSNQ